MTNRVGLRENMGTVYFTLISEASQYSYEGLLAQITKKLNQMIEAIYVGLYLYDDTQQKYVKIAEELGKLPVPDFSSYIDRLNQRDNSSSFTIKDTIFPLDSDMDRTFVLKLKAKYEPVDFLLVIYLEETLTENDLLLIKNETERFLSLANYFQENKINEKKNELLFSLSSLLHSSTDKNIILMNIIQSLNNIYPAFSHYLLLSHDFETNDTLPIKSIEYSEDEEKKSSSEAFITGEIQIETRTNPNHIRLYAPLLGNQGVYGVIQMISSKAMNITQSELKFITQISTTAGKALERAILYESSIDRATDLKLINSVTHRLNSYLTLPEVIQVLKGEITSICKPSEIGIVYYNKESEQGYTVFSESTPFFREREGQLFVDIIYGKMREKNDAVFSGNYSTIYSNFKYNSVILIPMIESNQTHGFIIVMHEQKAYFTFENFKLVQSLTHHATLALVNAVLREKLEKAVITDYLTGLYSRSYLDKMFNKHMQTDEQGTLILFDIDDFKEINDTYGHSMGDEVIIAIAEIIKNSVTKDDIAARWGGEEFAVYLPHVGLIKGVQVAEKIRRNVAEKTEPSVTFSCGVSTWRGKHTDSVNDVFIRADRALYEAKGIGKNRVIIDDQLSSYVNQ